MQSQQFFASTLREQLYELKNEDAIKKTGNLCDTRACQGLSINTMQSPIKSRETAPLNRAPISIITRTCFKKTSGGFLS